MKYKLDKVTFGSKEAKEEYILNGVILSLQYIGKESKLSPTEKALRILAIKDLKKVINYKKGKKICECPTCGEVIVYGLRQKTMAVAKRVLKKMNIQEPVDNLQTDYYKKYIGEFAKRFYTPFTKENIFQISGFEFYDEYAHFNMKDDKGNAWHWDVEDCVIITDRNADTEDERVANVNDSEYKGFNPFII
jgi:hypothetical protein